MNPIAPSTAGPGPTNAPERIHALDAARASALLLGIVLHATMSFFLPVPAQDVSQSTTLAVGFYVIHVFRMSLFFLIAGFFARMLFHRSGLRAFTANRVKRIVVPLTAGWVVLAPLTIAIVIWGLTRTFPGGLPEGADPGAMTADGLPLTHLWFLYYLCIFYALILALRWALVGTLDPRFKLGERVDRLVRAGLSSYLAPVALAAPLWMILYMDSGWMVWFGLPTPDTGLTPQLPAMAGFGTAFAFGWMLHRQTGLLPIFRNQWMVNLAVGAALTALCLGIVGLRPNIFAPTFLDGGPATRALYAAAYTLSIWYWTFGLIGMALRFFDRESSLRRYLADAAYWMYLVHIPVVFSLQVLIMKWPLHWSIKFSLILAITMAVLLASYHYLVRPTLIGAILNGKKIPRNSVTNSVTNSVRNPALQSGFRQESQETGGSPPESEREQRRPMPHSHSPGAASLQPVASLSRVSRRYGSTLALDGLSLEVRPGELLAVLGPNGAGKSTAIEIWLGTLEPDEGSVRLMGGCPSEAVNRLDVGMMLQDVQLAPMLSAREHIALASSCYRRPMSVEETVTLTAIEPFADKRYGKLSAGQKRQVQFAVALCGNPRLIFLDEPTVGLDVQARETLWRTIRGLVEDGRSVVLTTHYLEEAEALADRVAVLAGGRLIAEGSVAEMRALVDRRKISCISSIELALIQAWPGVIEASRESNLTHLTTAEPEALVRRLLEADPALSGLEVRQASLAEAFKQLTRDEA